MITLFWGGGGVHPNSCLSTFFLDGHIHLVLYVKFKSSFIHFIKKTAHHAQTWSNSYIKFGYQDALQLLFGTFFLMMNI